MTDIQALDSQYVAHTYARAPVTFVRGEGCHLYDEAGKPYIDMGSGIAVSALGYGDEGWVAAVSAQAGQLAHASNLYHTAPQALLAQRLCERTGMKRVFFGNSGAEANECAIKAARRYSALKHGENVRPVILTLENSFHGRTLATLAATGQDVFHHDFGPFPEGFRHIPPNDVAALKTALDVGDVCALLIETIQGEGGVCCLTEEYIQAARELTEARDILLMVDEVQTGNGRTGKLYSYQHFGILPDVVSTAKGLAGGLPMGACLLGDIVISYPRALEQAAEYGHSARRELCYLLAHGLFHLMGYDHMDPDEQKEMRAMEEKALGMAGIARGEGPASVTDAELLALARLAMENSYSPYSHYAVGAALLSADGRVFQGCNIENASFGLTNCAERTALVKAVSEGCRRFTKIAIASAGSAPYPCGACRQSLYEFAPELEVLVTWDGNVARAPLGELLPHGFGPSSLGK